MRGSALTDQHLTSNGEPVVTLHDLIRARIEERGWNYADLARRSGNRLTRSRWQQIGTGVRLRSFPEPASIEAMAAALEVDVTTVLLATAQSIGLDARRGGPTLAHLLPAGTDRLSDQMRDAILTLIRAAVADTLKGDEGDDDPDFRPELTTPLGWRKSPTSHRRNSAG